ncbi:two-component regulator propeller domain-containing protein [uncultured Parabacteroides sp.]|uniref:hybrid sensor histidine kinase/response regulator transcription factor n=1 Tax=uncultured Parabacteroides sp. TaxID=512312 RepID=UPI0025FF70F2|nr:two-component regulator propeller domain-containing protein [uncultured Parabacteroides sp.]
MRRIIILFIMLLGFCSGIYPIYFKHIGMQEGLSQLSVMAIYQDKLGRMWFGTEEGISIYNGVQTIVYKPSEFHRENTNPIGNQTHFIAGDKDGNVFFDSDNALIRYDIRTQKFSCLRQSGIVAISSIEGEIWVGVMDSVFTWNPETEKLDFAMKLEDSDQHLTCMKKDSGGRYWIGTTDGLYVKKEDEPLTCVIPGEDIYSLYEDSRYNLWISIRMNGMYKRDVYGNFTRYRYDPSNPNNISSNQVRDFAEDNFGNLWIGTFTGLNKYNPISDKFEVYARNPLPGSMTHSSVFPIYKDRQGTIWLGTYYGGVNYFNPETDIFTVYAANETRNDCLNYPFVGKMVEDKDNNVWICTEGGGLHFFDRKTKKFTYFMANENRNSIAHNNLKAIAYSPERNKLYIGTHTGGLSIYDIKNKKFKNPYFEDPSYAVIAGDRINYMCIYNNELICTGPKGIFKMNLDTEKVSPLFDSGKYYGNTCFRVDSKGYLWLAYGKGVWKINLKDETDQIQFRSGENGLGIFPISQIIEDKQGRIFLGTRGSGLFCYDEKDNRFTGYTTENSFIASNYCYELALSTIDQLVITGDKGITFFDPDQNLFRVVELGTALPLSGINIGCGILVCKNGEIFVGGSNGMATFFEQQLFNSTKDYQLYFSDLYINNDLVTPGNPDKVLNAALPYTQDIELAYNQNNLIFTFTSNNYVNTLKKAAYEYRLEGFDKRWISSKDNNISYTNLNPGKYTLVVQEIQYDPTQEHPRTIRMNIHIHSPWYASRLAYLLYLVLIASLLYSFYRFKKSQFMLQTSLEMERKEKESIEELNQAKLQFFSNISHEFRTPLTLIISQIELLLQSSSLSPSVYNKLLKVYKNTYHMRNLISELLDFRKLEQGHVKLKVYEQNIVPFLKEIYLSFYEYASSRSITYKFTAPEEEISCWFDPKQMQKVFYNLLSNAFKYTKPNATVELILENMDDEVIIKVIDNGVGISKEDIDKIFDRFYQAENGISNITKTPSTGIGLALTKNIIELHHGMIQVESTPGYGSIFIVRLLKGSAQFTEAERAQEKLEDQQDSLIPDTVALTDHMEEFPDTDRQETLTIEGDDSPRSILLVEDNEELLQILTSLFSPAYRVILARNGKEGLEKAREERPDIIVSDVMMPEMSGTEMCMKIKNDFDVCHIPVVLLTALTSAEQNIEGLQRGADDYVNKPFNAKVLQARCNNLVRNRIILQKKFSRQKDFDAQSLASNPIDQKFLDTVNSIIEKNLDNIDFDMNMMARELGLSRSSLYAKFKALTGMTPNEFVLNCKLKRAAAMLTDNPDLQIADISDQLGFGSPRYFTRCFKAQFEITPAEYRKKVP